jgi:hypothetical protein
MIRAGFVGRWAALPDERSTAIRRNGGADR